ncbi:unnamed protein product [Linum trigynum]|uniref:Uncharacterized protein n=1 Tax=Linum trigynum TaxID=586398 RepID=A0AAV2F2N0_9ROSI
MQAAAAASSALELAEHQPTVWAHTNGYISTMTVQCAVQLEIPDVIQSHGRPMTLHQLLSALQISPAKAPFMARLMRVLVHLGYFVEHNDSFWLTPLSRFLLKDNPFGGRSMLLLGSHPIMLDPWRSMSTWFRTANEDEKQQQQPPFAFANGGKKLYEVAAADPWVSRLYHDGLGCDSSLFAASLVAKCGSSSGVFEGLSSLVDVGRNSGTGTTGQVLAAAFPDIDITVFDLPHAVAGLEAAAQPNLRYVGGDMFKDIPPADAVLLMRVLIELEDEACMELLKQCKKAVSNRGGAGGAGKVMIADHVLGHESCNDQVSEGTLLFTDMVMMACLEGSIRTEPQWSQLFSQAGFSNYKITLVCGLWFLIQLEL